MRKRYVWAALLLVSLQPPASPAQQSAREFSLKSAQDYAVKNSYQTINSNTDIEIARKKVKETTGIGLPQISASGSFQYYFDIPTMLMPNFLTPVVDGVLLQHGLITQEEMLDMGDDKIPVQFGSDYNLSGDVTASQLIFDGSYIVGLQAAKVYVDFSKQNHARTEIEVKEAVAQTYYLVLVAGENRKILVTTLEILGKSHAEVKEMLKNGFVEESDADQLQLLVANLQNKLTMVDRQIDLAYNLLKFQMGIPVTEKISLTDGLEDLVKQSMAENLASKSFDFKNHIDYKLMQTQKNLSLLNLKRDQSGYLPSLAAYLSVSTNAMRSEFNFFRKEEDWFRTTVLGLSLSVPIWNSGIKHYKIQQDKLQLDKINTLERQVKEGLELEVENARSTLSTFTDQYASDAENLDLAKSIYDKTLIKYKEGVATSMELTQAHNQYLTAQGNYFNTSLELLNARSKLNKALNNY